jgi:uncharacterized lipoprotein YddW (UPF0748 family)
MLPPPCLLAVSLALAAPLPRPATLAAEHELRGAWLGLDSGACASQASIADAMDNLAAWGFNTVFVQVLDGAQTLYPSPVIHAESGSAIDRRFEGRDLLAEFVVEGHRAGLEIVPWLSGGLTYAANGPAAPLATARPEWLCVGAQGTRLESAGSYWFDWLDADVQSFASALLADLVQRYEVDGLQLDDRFPAVPKDALADSDSLASPTARAAALTDWLASTRQRLLAIDPHLVWMAAPSEAAAGTQEYAQDTAAWSARHLLDHVMVQARNRDFAVWQTTVGQLELGQFTPAMFQRLPAGSFTKAGDPRLPSRLLVEAVAWSRAGSGASQVSFTYEGLLARGNELPAALRRGPYRSTAITPWRDAVAWRPRGMIFPGSLEGAEGPWHVDAEWPDFHVLDGGVQGSFGWWVQQPHSAWFDVHVWLPSHKNPLATHATYLLQGEQQRSWIELDMTAITQSGWVRLGSVDLRGGELYEPLRLIATETSKDLHTAAGPLLLVLNRRLSPDARW